MRSARLTPVEVDENLIGQESEPAQQEQSQAANALTGLLFMSLKALSQRAIVALGSLFMVVTAFSVWWLWYTVIAAEEILSPLKVVMMTIYAAFILALNWMFLRRR